MADSMDKASVIWPVDYAKDEKKKITIKDAPAKWGDIEKTVEAKLGYLPDMKEAKSLFDDAAGKKKNAAAKRDCSGFVPTEAYVKVGVVKGNLVFRAKQPKTLGDIEYDALVAKNYPAQAGKQGTRKTALGRVQQGYVVDDILKIPNLRNIGYSLAKTKWFHEENWAFLIEAGQYEKKRPTDAAAAKKWCKDIYDKFVPATAALQINLPAEIKEALDASVGAAPSKAYDEALTSAHKNILAMEKNNWAYGGTGGTPHQHFKQAVEKSLLDEYRKDNK
ncbi:MAG: hypothetical protein ACAI25_18005 [Planctomycetota bacterium]